MRATARSSLRVSTVTRFGTPSGNAQILHGAAGIIQQDQIELFILDTAEQRLDIFNGRLCLAQRLAGDALFKV